MDRERWQRVEKIFHAALERTAEDRAAFLEEACSGDTTLRDEVAALLRHDDSDAGFMETPALAAIQPSGNGAERDTAEATLLSDTPPDAPHVEGELPAGHLIENYRIVRKIGAGGMGDVYLAEDLQLGRRVALKLLPPAIHADGKSGRRFLREARAASALNHPHIVTIHSVKEAEGQSFIEMEFIEGESLRERLLRGPLDVSEVIALGLDAADAASAAHAINIVHRDLKPGNILFTASGKAKIVDFGLAKAAGAASGGSSEAVVEMPPGLSSFSMSQVGSISGTVPYMSPEQTRGEHVDARSDIFSLGCVLYEAATGRRPFDGDCPAEIIPKIREQEPPRPSSVRPGLPRGLDGIILKALAKDKSQRFGSAIELATALRSLQTRETLRRYWRWIRVPAAVIVVSALAFFFWKYQRQQNELRAVAIADAARARIPEVETLVEEYRFFEAHDLARELLAVIPEDEELNRLKVISTDIFTVRTTPAGADVYLQRYQPDPTGRFPQPELVGTTPINRMEIARGAYLLRIERPGYVPVERTISSMFGRTERGFWEPGKLRSAELFQDAEGNYGFRVDSEAPIELDVTLHPSGSVPVGMTPIAGGPYNLVAWGRPVEEIVNLDDFFIDRCEVTNGEFEEFVEAGGYQNRDFWQHPFLRDGDELPWEEAMAVFRDPQRNGPASWPGGRAPQGRERHPVTNVSWYEAAAYAQFRGKQLPSLFQWEHAARGAARGAHDGRFTVIWARIMPWGLNELSEDLTNRTNVNSHGTMPVGSFPFGMSPYGCYDMSGNVWEWCFNPRPGGYTTAGGSWREGPNLFSSYGDFPGFYCSDSLGFRCIRCNPGAEGDQGGMFLPNIEPIEVPAPLSLDAYRLISSFYEYDPRDLDAETVERSETNEWIRLKVRYIGANGQRAEPDDIIPDDKRALAYLWLPKNAEPPFQVVNYKPGGATYEGLTVPQETEVVCAPFLHSGRAVFVVLIEGMTERPLAPDWVSPQVDTVAYRDMLVYDTLDQRIGLDYLASRDDIDTDRIMCMGLSMGGYDLVTMAVERRFKSVLLLSAGLGVRKKRIIDAADPVNFAPYIDGPKMMIHGRYDEGIPFERRARPLYELLGEPKELVVLESGHFPPMDQWVPHALRFLDATLGPVETTENSTEVAQGRE